MKSSLLTRRDRASSMSRCPGKGLDTTQATLSWRANSREINSPPERPLAYHASSGARYAINLLAASLAQKFPPYPSIILSQRRPFLADGASQNAQTRPATPCTPSPRGGCPHEAGYG